MWQGYFLLPLLWFSWEWIFSKQILSSLFSLTHSACGEMESLVALVNLGRKNIMLGGRWSQHLYLEGESSLIREFSSRKTVRHSSYAAFSNLAFISNKSQLFGPPFVISLFRPWQGRGELFIGNLLETPTSGTLTRTVRTKNKRLEIREAKYILERLLERETSVTLTVHRDFY